MKATTGIVIAVLGVAVACGGSKSKPVASSNDEMASLDAGTDLNWEGDSGTGSGEGGAAASAAIADGAGGTEDGAKALLKQFVDPKADHAALSKSLKPTAADYKALFDDATAPKMAAAYAKEWDSGKMVIKPKNDKQSEIKLWGATGAELAQGSGNAKEFPGGYKKIGKHLAPTVTFYAFKFVEPKKDSGMAYDGLAHVNGHWVIIPKPFHMDGGGGGGEDHPHDKPHPKKKKP